MPKKTYTPEQIINKLREAEVLLSQGATLAVIWKKPGVSDCTYYRWRKEYGGMTVDQAHLLKELEQENSRLERLVAAQGEADGRIVWAYLSADMLASTICEQIQAIL